MKRLERDADAMMVATLNDCIDGEYVEIAGKDPTYEVLHYQTGLTDPMARIVTHQARPLNLVVAVARWVWLMAGNDRLEDIRYYEPKVGGFSDNGLTVPGSCYGARLFNQNRIDQIGSGVIQRLALDPNSRQATAVVWRADDAVADDSRDIPCTHGMFFHIRDNALNLCVTMRSNNAFRILPFNIFEFTMLQEYVATSLGIPLGDYVHWAASMHVYKNEREWEPTLSMSQDLDENGRAFQSIVMPVMPNDDVAHQVNTLCQLEAKLRHATNEGAIREISSAAANMLNVYWFGLYGILASWTEVRHGIPADFGKVPEWAKDLTRNAIRSAVEKGQI